MNMHSPFGWTAERRAAFLASLAACGTVRTAAKSVDLSAQAAYKLRARDPAFARAWDAALAIARDHLVAHLTTVAFEGWTEEVWYKGELVGERTRQNPMVAMRLLERLDRMAERQVAPVENFDTLSRAESAGAAIEDPLVRSEADLEEQVSEANSSARLYRMRDLERHLAILRASEPPPTCDHDDCPACEAALDALWLDPTAQFAVSDSGGVLGCLYPDDMPNRDIRVGTIYDPWQAAREEAAMLDELALANYARHQAAMKPVQVQPVELADGQVEDGQGEDGQGDCDRQGDQADSSDSPAFPALECQPVSTCAADVTEDEGCPAAPPLSTEPADPASQPVGPEPVEGQFMLAQDAAPMINERLWQQGTGARASSATDDAPTTVAQEPEPGQPSSIDHSSTSTARRLIDPGEL